MQNIQLVGGKNASGGEMYQELASKGLKDPNGSAITAEAYRQISRETKLDTTIKEIFKDLQRDDLANLRQRGGQLYAD